ncbi:MAG: peptidylprolyl isomerase [Erysipelotrichaceae bacterium]|nr:peptidylprolyl isomerase [Erysipelotrichaceae bacterium]
MKHRKLSISLISAFIAALGLSACSDVTAKDNSILTLKGYDGETIDIDAGAIFNQYKTSADGISSFYKAILEVLIRNYFETSTDADVKSKLASLKTQAENKVKGVEEEARLNAEKNGTSYEEEWNKLLDSNKVEDRDELKALFLYNFEKAEIEDKYFENNLSSLTSEYIGFKQDNSNAWGAYRGDEHSAMLPYHIRHILVKTTASATDFTSSEITQDEAKKLDTVYEALASGKNTFGQVAASWSDDSSASVFGDSGIMDVSENFVNEFKLGIYAYDGLYGKSVTGAQSINRDDYFGLSDSYNGSSATSTVKDQLSNIGLGQVSYEVFLRLGETYKTEKSDGGESVNDGVTKYFPRNIYWNNYLNLHNVFVITDNGLTDSGTHWTKPGLDANGKTGFREVSGLGLAAGTKVLTDEVGRVVIGVRSEYGIHFMIMQRTPFELDGTISSYNDSTKSYSYNDVKINEYYTTKVPGDQGYPQTTEGKDKVTYVNFLNADKSVYTERADKVETKIKGFDSMYDYRIYEQFAANNQIQINDPTVKTEIDRYIAQKREYIEWSDEQNVTKTWQTYLDLLNLQYEMRDDDYGTNLDGSKRLTKVTCAINFGSYDPNDALWKKGGACYYGK